MLEGIRAAEEAGLAPIKINVVVQKGVNEHTIVDLTRRVKDMGHILRFIEFMDVGNLNQWRSDQVVTAQEIIGMIDREMPLEPVGKSYRGEVADRYGVRRRQGRDRGHILGKQPVLRRLHPVPHLGGGEGVHLACSLRRVDDLRGPLRAGATDADLTDIIKGIWGRRADRYSEDRASFVREPGQKGGDVPHRRLARLIWTARREYLKMPNYWMIVSSAENFEISRELGFLVQGIKSRHREKAERMEPGDRVLYYLDGSAAVRRNGDHNVALLRRSRPDLEQQEEGRGVSLPVRYQARDDPSSRERTWTPRR